MCWITLTPTKNKPKRASSDCSSAEIVRVHRSPRPRLSSVSVSLPSNVTSTSNHHHHHHHDSLLLHPHLPSRFHPHAPIPHGLLQHHHRHPHLHPLHPLHLHPPMPLHGPGKKIKVDIPCPPLPTSQCSSPSSLPSSVSSKPKEPIYRTQIVEPGVRATTRTALRDVRFDGMRSRVGMRRVGGYEVLRRDVPWDWDCVSSTVGSGSSVEPGKKKAKGKKKKGGLKYPPFGGMERWL